MVRCGAAKKIWKCLYKFSIQLDVNYVGKAFEKKILFFHKKNYENYENFSEMITVLRLAQYTTTV